MMMIVVFFACVFISGTTQNPFWLAPVLLVGAWEVLRVASAELQHAVFTEYGRRNARDTVVVGAAIAAIAVIGILFGVAFYEPNDYQPLRHGALTPDGYCNHLVNPVDDDGLCDKCGGKL